MRCKSEESKYELRKEAWLRLGFFVLRGNQLLQIVFHFFVRDGQVNHFEEGIFFILTQYIDQLYFFLERQIYILFHVIGFKERWVDVNYNFMKVSKAM